MILSKTFKIAISNWSTLLKSLIFQLCSLALFVAGASFVFGPLAEDVINAFQSNGVNDTIAHTLQSLTQGTFNVEHFLNEDLKTLVLSIKTSIESVPNMWNRVEISVGICVVVFLISRFFGSFTDVAAGCQIDEFMSSNAERPFLWFLFKKFGRSVAFVGLQMLLAIVVDTLIIGASVAMAVICTFIFGWWAIIPVLVIGVLLYAIRHSLMAFCLPSVVHSDPAKVGVSFGEGLSLSIKNFGKIFPRTLLLISVLTLTSAVAYLFNENRILALAISAAINFVLFFVVKCLNFVLYYEVNNYPYFFKRLLLEGTERYNRKNKKQK